MRSSLALVAALVLAVAACREPTAPPADPDPVPLTPMPRGSIIDETLRPDFENVVAACAKDHNSGVECQKLYGAAWIASGEAARRCAASGWNVVVCGLGGAAAGVAWNTWAAGTDAYGHRGPEDCGWCVDPGRAPAEGNPGGSSLGNREAP